MNQNTFLIYYKDDFNNKHIATTQTLREVKFYKDRFGDNNVYIEQTKVNKPSYEHDVPLVQW